MKGVFLLIALLCLTPYVSAPGGLLLGLAIALLFGNPMRAESQRWAPKLLQISVVALGAGMDLRLIAQAGVESIGYTVVGIAFTLILGLVLGRLLNTDAETSLLLSVGTAICGGSAIAAITPIIKAKPESVSLAMVTVFLLNSLALFIFPPLGHALSLDQAQFGLWSALAIHDTSSVVGAASHYGPQALEIAAVAKLARALWIVPVAILVGVVARKTGRGDPAAKAKKPWFILGFVLSAALVTFIPALKPAGLMLSAQARHAFVLTLFLIGSGVDRTALQRLGFKPLLQGLFLWALTASLSLALILTQVAH